MLYLVSPFPLIIFIHLFFFYSIFIFWHVFSREPRLYKRVCPSVGPSVRGSVGPSVRNHFFRRAETKTANDLFRVYELVLLYLSYKSKF